MRPKRECRKLKAGRIVIAFLIQAMILSSCADGSVNSSPGVVFETIPETEEPMNKSDAIQNAGDGVAEEFRQDKVVIHSIEEYIEYDTVYLDDEKKAILENSPAIEIYDVFLQKELPRLYDEISYPARMGLGWVDEDDIPELFLCQANATAMGVHIYTMNSDTNEVFSLGEFSQFGYCLYHERKNRIWSQYGNQGYYRECFTEIDNGRAKMIGGILSDGSGVRSDEVLYYAGFPVSEELAGSWEEREAIDDVFDISWEDYLVDEETFGKAYDQLMCCEDEGTVLVKMLYDDMIEIEPDGGY